MKKKYASLRANQQKRDNITVRVISLGISVLCIRKKWTQAVTDEQYPILGRLTKGKFLKPVAERNKERSANVKFWQAKGKFKMKDGTLMYIDKKVSVAVFFL